MFQRPFLSLSSVKQFLLLRRLFQVFLCRQAAILGLIEIQACLHLCLFGQAFNQVFHACLQNSVLFLLVGIHIRQPLPILFFCYQQTFFQGLRRLPRLLFRRPFFCLLCRFFRFAILRRRLFGLSLSGCPFALRTSSKWFCSRWSNAACFFASDCCRIFILLLPAGCLFSFSTILPPRKKTA